MSRPAISSPFSFPTVGDSGLSTGLLKPLPKFHRQSPYWNWPAGQVEMQFPFSFPGTVVFVVAVPDASIPDAVVPDASIPDAVVPDAVVPDVSLFSRVETPFLLPPPVWALKPCPLPRDR